MNAIEFAQPERARVRTAISSMPAALATCVSASGHNVHCDAVSQRFCASTLRSASAMNAIEIAPAIMPDSSLDRLRTSSPSAPVVTMVVAIESSGAR
jgi:hypothetical protein